MCDHDIPSTSQLQDGQEKVAQMGEYYEQYIEEYYEVDEEKTDLPEKEAKEASRYPKSLLTTERGVEGVFDVEELVHILREERAADIVCIAVPPSAGPHPYVVVCSPYNPRHGQALVQTLRKCYKIKCNFKEDSVPRAVKNAFGWHCFDMGNIILHVMSPNTRKKYDLEMLWGVGDEDNSEKDSVEAL